MTARIARLVSVAATFGALLSFPAQSPAAVHGLTLGFTDYTAFEFYTGADRQLALQRAHGAGASIIRLGMDWASTSPTKPPSLAQERDPSWAGYNWADTDSTVRDTAANGLRPLMLISDAPGWAEGANRPSLSVAPPAAGARRRRTSARSPRQPPSATPAPSPTPPTRATSCPG